MQMVFQAGSQTERQRYNHWQGEACGGGEGTRGTMSREDKE